MGVNPLQAVTNRFPQTNRVTEAPEVVFGLAQGARVLKPLPPCIHQMEVASVL